MEQYAYQPLCTAPNSIRLLRILPAIEGAEIYCELLDYTIQPHCGLALYEALSYAWGNPSYQRRIYVQENGGHGACTKRFNYLDVTTNLYAALQHLRDPVLPRVMWIDAVCINQRDFKERGNQVQFMARIYSQASRVIVWLGTNADNSMQLLAFLESAAAKLSYLEGDLKESWISVNSDRKKLVHSLVAMLDRPWFHRLWVLQEAASAKHLAIVCGKAEVAGNAFSLGIRCLLSHYASEPSLQWSDSPVLGVVSDANYTIAQASYTSSEQLSQDSASLDVAPLGELLDSFYALQATDPRDKVFALLGMNRGTDYARPPPQPDYTKDWATVFIELIAYLFGPSVQVTTHNDAQCAVILGTGHFIGRVVEIDSTSGWIDITGQHFSGPQDIQLKCRLSWPSNPHWKRILRGDILWQMDGAAYPSIIRFCVDHFDIIMVSTNPKEVSLNFGSRSFPVNWRALLKALQKKGRSLTLVWDWTRVTEGTLTYHVALFQADMTYSMGYPSDSSRIGTSLQIFDDVRHHSHFAVLSTALDRCVEPAETSTGRLHETICTYWLSYEWLKTRIERVRWNIWELERLPAKEADALDHVLEYWHSEGVQPHHVHQTASLFNQEWLFKLLQSHYEKNHFTQHETTSSNMRSDLRDVPSQDIYNTRPEDDRYLIELILEQKDLKPRGSRIIPANIISAHLDRLICQKTTPNNLFVSIIAVHAGNLPFLSLTSYEATTGYSNSRNNFSKLLVQFSDSVQDIYRILTAAIKDCLEMEYDKSRGGTPHSERASDDSCAEMFKLDPTTIPDSNSEYYPESILSIDSNLDLYDYWIAPFVHEHVPILLPVLEDTSLCETAHGKENDHVIDVLQQLFPSRAYRDTIGFCAPCQDSFLILDGIERWKKAEVYESEDLDSDRDDDDEEEVEGDEDMMDVESEGKSVKES